MSKETPLAISLGKSFIVKANLDIYCRNKNGEDAPAFIFDWLMGGELYGVSKALTCGLQFNKEDFTIEKINANWWVPTHKPTGFNFLHEFQLNNQFENKNEVEQKFNANFQNFADKYSYLAQKTLDTF